MQVEFYALEGLTQLIQTIELIKLNFNNSLDLQGIVLTMYDKRNKISELVAQDVKNHFKEKVMTENLIVSSANEIAGFEIKEHIGIVQGSTVRAKNIGSDFFAGLKNIIGGELVAYSQLLQSSREQAYERMIEDAKSKGANAIVGFRFQTSTITQGASEILAYGTGIKI